MLQWECSDPRTSGNLFFHHLDPSDKAQIVTLGSKFPYAQGQLKLNDDPHLNVLLGLQSLRGH